MTETRDEFEIAQDGLKRIEDAIIRLLEKHPPGLRNSEIAEELGLRSDFKGKAAGLSDVFSSGRSAPQGTGSVGPEDEAVTKAK